MLCLLLLIASGPAFADVSNELMVGTESDSAQQIKGTLYNIHQDYSDYYRTANYETDLQYTRFFSPLRDDGTPIELRRFLQHPSTIFAGLGVVAAITKDYSDPLGFLERRGKNSLYAIGGELYSSGGTGLILDYGKGDGWQQEKMNGIIQPGTKIHLASSEIGVRQYVAPKLSIHLAVVEDSWSATQRYAADIESETRTTLIGAQGVLGESVDLAVELGRGHGSDKQSGNDYLTYNVNQTDLTVTYLVGKHFSLALDADEERTNSSAPGSYPSNYTEIEKTFTVSPTCWFSEMLGVQVSLYTRLYKYEGAPVFGVLTVTDEKDNGIGAYASLRF